MGRIAERRIRGLKSRIRRGRLDGECMVGIRLSEMMLIKSRWAAAIFEVENGKVRSFTKDWDQKVMQIQLGWAPVTGSEDARWNEDMLRDPEKARESGQ